MKTTHIRSRLSGNGVQRGFTLVELMISILIGLFLLGGLLTLTSAMKRTSGIQGGLEQLHDSERLAATLMNDVIQSAGYYPNPVVNTAAAEFPVTGAFTQAGQSIVGTDGGTASAQLDTVSVRYVTAGGDGIINCIGGTSAVAATWVNTFQLDGNGNLQCVLTTNGTVAAAVTLVSGVNISGVNVSGAKYLQILYGVQSNTGSGTHSVDCYLTATQVTAGNYWGNVISVQITLYFANPLYGQPGQTATTLATIPFTRVIDLMTKTGVNT